MEKPEHNATAAMLPTGGHSVALDHLHSWPATTSGGHRMAGGPCHTCPWAVGTFS